MNLVNPYYAEKLKERGSKVKDLKIIKHFFIPSEKDLEKLANFIVDCKTAIDVGSGYGLLINELAKKTPEIKYLGIDTMYWDKKFPLPKAEKNVAFEFMGIEPMAYPEKWNKKLKKFDCVICCWMPEGRDWNEMLAKISNKKIILIHSKDFASGTLETYVSMGKLGFKLHGRVWQTKDSLIQLWERV